MTPRAEHMGHEVRVKRTGEKCRIIEWSHTIGGYTRVTVEMLGGGPVDEVVSALPVIKRFHAYELDADPLPPVTEVAPHD